MCVGEACSALSGNWRVGGRQWLFCQPKSHCKCKKVVEGRTAAADMSMTLRNVTMIRYVAAVNAVYSVNLVVQLASDIC